MEKKEDLCTADGILICTSTMESNEEDSQNIRRATMWSSDSTSGTISEDHENNDLKRYMHPYVHCCILYNSQAMEIT